MSTIVKVFYLVSLYNEILPFISSVHIKAVSSLIIFLILSESFVFYTSLHVTLRKWAQSNKNEFGCKTVPKPEENKQLCLKTFKWLSALIYTNNLWPKIRAGILFSSLLLVSYSLYFCLSTSPPFVAGCDAFHLVVFSCSENAAGLVNWVMPRTIYLHNVWKYSLTV
jgi:hypothetical protein